MARHRVFVYGTLKAGEPNHHILMGPTPGSSTTTFISKALTLPTFPMVIASRYNIPFVIDQAGHGHRIHGEVYEVDDETLKRLDILECHPEYYERRPVIVELLTTVADPNSNGTAVADFVTCQMYLLHGFQPGLLEKQFLETYSSSGEHGLPYVLPEHRVPESEYDTKWEVKVDHGGLKFSSS